MNRKDLLWNKATKEYSKFEQEQLELSKKEIFDNAFKISMMYNLKELCNPINNLLSDKQVNILLKEKNSIDTLYNIYLKSEGGSLNEIYENVWYRLNDLDKSNRNLKDFCEER